MDSLGVAGDVVFRCHISHATLLAHTSLALIERFFLVCPKQLALYDPRTRPRSVQVNVDRLSHPKDKRAGVLQSPLHVGNVEVDGQVPVVRREFNLRWDGDLMLGSVNDEHAMDLHV